ncbi:MAG: ATP-dependent Clp protease adaptor ClpS [Nitrospinota bacterium]|nr:ATP-dependent Clp protease adaptor ClpS [Nitrospinota bacterium]MDH5677550.1 ATP-dependent Clp protease adaptor ClpS [Nitrospinota bacterium]MDH5757706.1 ATP-dependent Clp protease adaptor ClpS [Nitrospinota bacterium]
MVEKPLADIDSREDTLVDQRQEPLYWVIMHNDPVTTMDFVVMILMRTFGHAMDKAQELMLEIHHTGSSRVALLPLAMAKFKVGRVHMAARAHGFPLTCSVEPD